MTDTFQTTSLLAIDTFLKLMKEPLQKILEGEVISVEKETHASSPTALLLDKSASSDLIIKYKTTSTLFFASSRIMYFKHLYGCKSFQFSITLRDSVKGLFDITELNKLHAAISMLDNGIPVIVPRYLCYGRVYPMEAPTTLYDILVVDTIPLIKHIFSSSQMNIAKLRLKKKTSGAKEIYISENMKSLAGIRTNGENGSTFLFISKDYIDMNGLPYLYQTL